MKPIKPEEINPICRRCRGKCKQPIYVQLLSCPHFDKKPEQLEIDLKPRHSRKTNKPS
ncbi:MAG: hypothetical protein FJ042_00115 [Candidatus Cloacimonetes bacterium]|nr:hypothetical protein [Candidatus Cloacimonadota bacterium]